MTGVATPNALSWLSTHSSAIQAFSALVGTVGIPFILMMFFIDRRREQRIREFETYNDLGERYVEYQRHASEHTELDLSWHSQAFNQRPLTREELVHQALMYEVLTDLLVRAFHAHEWLRGDLAKRKWREWELWIRDLCRIPAYRAFWETNPDGPSEWFDPKFVKYMRTVLASVPNSNAIQSPEKVG